MTQKITKEDLCLIVEKLYKMLDVNGDKKLSRDELREFFKNMSAAHGQTFSEETFEESWKEVDENGDEAVTQQELYNYMLKQSIKDGQIVDAEEN